jgi:DNA-directed RNA polymerase specialized sigma24 family protein
MSTAKRDYKLEIPLEGLTRAEDGEGRSLASDDPTPSQIAVANESFDNLRSGLDSDGAKALELAREGRSTIEIAGTLGMNVRKVQRLLKSAYDSWVLRGGVRP